MNSDLSGRGAAPIMRDRKTGQKRDLEKEKLEELEKAEKSSKQNEKYAKWGRGCVSNSYVLILFYCRNMPSIYLPRTVAASSAATVERSQKLVPATAGYLCSCYCGTIIQ